MLLEHLDHPVQTDALDTDQVVALAREVVAAISSLPDGLPTYVDISTRDRWRRVVEQTLDAWRVLVDGRRFTQHVDDIVFVQRWATSPGTLALIDEQPGIANGDMKFDHVFYGPNGLQVIDWSAAVHGPPDIDLVMLLEDRNIDPLRHVAARVYRLRWFLLLKWAIVAKSHLLPDVPTMFDDWGNRCPPPHPAPGIALATRRLLASSIERPADDGAPVS